MKQLCVSVPAALADQHAVLATLPNRYRIGSDEADLIAIDGADPVCAAPLPVMLVRPGLITAPALRALAEGRNAVGLALHAAPALTEDAVALMQLPGDDATLIVDASAETDGSLRDALFELLMLLDRLGCCAEAIRLLAATPTQLTLGVASDGVWQGVRVTARRSFRTAFALETVSRRFRRGIAISGTAVAAAADVRLFDATGTRVAAPHFEGGLRASWRAFHGQLGEGGSGTVATAIRLLDMLDAAGV